MKRYIVAFEGLGSAESEGFYSAFLELVKGNIDV